MHDHDLYNHPGYRLTHDPPHTATWSVERRKAAWARYDEQQTSLPRLPTGVEDTEGWAYRRARTCEATLSLEELADAADERVDVRAISGSMITGRGFARFNGRWFLPLTRTAVASGLDPVSHPGEFIALDDAECMALERVCEHWRVQAEGNR